MQKEFIKFDEPKTLKRSISQSTLNKRRNYNNYNKPQNTIYSNYRNTSSKYLFNGNDLSKFFNKNNKVFNINKILSRNKSKPFNKKKLNINSCNTVSNHTLNNFERSSSIRNSKKCKNFFRNNIKKDLFNEINFLPSIKPRKILIDFYAGSNELHMQNVNKKYNALTYKQYGHNGHYMGDNYDPTNYFRQPKNRISTNYYGALFQN